MAIRYDLPIDSDGDLNIGISTMRGVPSDLRHQEDMFSSMPGEWKQYPQNGVGVPRYIRATSTGVTFLILKNKGKQSLKADGYIVKAINFTYDSTGKLLIITDTTR